MPELSEAQAELLARRKARDDARAELRAAAFRVRTIDAAIADAERSQPGPNADGHAQQDERLAALRHRRAELAGAQEERADALRGARERVRELGAGILALGPEQLLRQLDDRVPLLLLPLRIETKFAGDSRARQLLVRIFPDEIAIAAHEQMLTGEEAAAGRRYWQARAKANAAPDAQQRQNAERAAWNTLAGRHGAYRASWIAKTTEPRDWSERAIDPDALVFEPLETKPAGWTEAPRSFVLPDRFVVVLISGAQQQSFVGGPVDDDLAFGPDPLQLEGMLTRSAGDERVSVDESMRWLLDFQAAVDAGMALRIALPAPFDAAPIERLIVLGVRASEDASQGAAQLARLLDSHRYSEGVAIVAQGTPSNNTNDAGSGFTTANVTIDESFAQTQLPPLMASADALNAVDGQRLAHALGIPLETMNALPGATLGDVGDGLAMNRALWAGTMGGFVRDMLHPLIDEPSTARLADFYQHFVLGRGLLPAIRVGNQPYGVLVTSALRRWEWSQPEAGDAQKFWDMLLFHVRQTETYMREQLVPKISFVGKSGSPFKHLMSVIGLQASSVELYSRTAITTDYLANYVAIANKTGRYTTALWEQLEKDRADLALLGLNRFTPYKLKELVFWREHDMLSAPMIDGDPAVPLSESERLRSYDGTHNYIDWLAQATQAQLEAEEFHGADGKRVAAPEATLYKLLRHAYLAELGHSGLRFAKARVAAFAELPDEPLIANIGANKVLLQKDLLGIDLAKAGVSVGASAGGGAPSKTAGEYLLAQARSALPSIAIAPEAAQLSTMTQALGRLTHMTTAQLERAFTESIDTCSYRLDAWISGLFAKRLQQLRQERVAPRGVYLGACGWVENLAPSKSEKRAVAPEQLPAALRKGLDGPVVELTGAGGYVHAPSLTHAVTAAVLRNAFMSHASSPDAETFAVNLSSSRVRAAQRLLEGLRNGQDLAALLGYQLERGLHEGHPDLELDELIYVLRERFPLLSKKVSAVAAGTAVETIEARNVVNGYELVEHVRQRKIAKEKFPYGITGLVTAPDGKSIAQTRRDAVDQEIDRMADALDALGDLMLAESVHQVVQGNYERAHGTLQAVTDGESPPDMEVVQTPRSGRILNFRIALRLDPAQVSGWRPKLTLRAQLNGALNHWLASVLPAAASVQWQVRDRAQAPVFVTADSLALEPLDLVLMSGEGCGELSSELERFAVHAFRAANAVPDDVPAVAVAVAAGAPAPGPVANRMLFDFAAAPAAAHSLASLWPLLKALRRLVCQTRALHANDYRLPTEAQSADPANPRGYDDVAGLRAKVAAARVQLKALADDLAAFLTTQIDPPYDALQSSQLVTPVWGDPGGLLVELRKRLLAIARCGVSEALPANAVNSDRAAIDALVAQAHALVPILTARLAQALTLLDTAFADPLPADPAEAARATGHRLQVLHDQYCEAARVLLGNSLRLLPTFELPAAARAEYDTARLVNIEPDPRAVERWLGPVARVRENAAALSRVATYREWLHGSVPALEPVQLPHRPGDRWIGAELGTLAASDMLSLMHVDGTSSAAGSQCGLLLDEWSELVPTERETTGLAFQANRPNAQPPQALLLAVAPQLRGAWQWDDLVAIVVDTIDRAKLRAVEPDLLVDTPYFQLLPAALQEFSNSYLASTRLVSGAARERV